MKKIIILGLTTTVIALASFSASADSDSQYPAANFQPKVVYIDKDAVKSSPKCQDQSPQKRQPNSTPNTRPPTLPLKSFIHNPAFQKVSLKPGSPFTGPPPPSGHKYPHNFFTL
ncbi:MAG: hypothetical protein ACXWT4_16650 [Methylobacter sp.]